MACEVREKMKREKGSICKKIIGVSTAFCGMYFAMRAIAKKRAGSNEINIDNPYMNGKENVPVALTTYEKLIKSMIDKGLAFMGMIILSPLFAVISVAIFIDDPGPVLFTQKRVGENKEFFWLHKFRSMNMSTPHDVPTHQLSDPEHYITKVGKVLRKTSLDELPQIWDIFRGKMSIIGPRPALWNQEDLVEEREKYDANSVKPGLTGWAQINGRDELEINEKAKLDGEYVKHLRQGGIKALFFDAKCFLGTIKTVLSSDGVVEGGTGEISRNSINQVDSMDAGFEDYGYKKTFYINKTACKHVLITGAGSYIGESFEAYAKKYYGKNFLIDTVDMLDSSWRQTDFSSYDAVFHVAGIAHADTGNVNEETKKKYYMVNTDLAIEVARLAKNAGVKQFVFMSSMIVYGEPAPFGKGKIIDKNTLPAPANFYGDSKWQADKGVRRLANENYHVAVLRPPMIYGPDSKGNYPILEKLAKKLPLFPDVNNQRSMLYIENLCEFLCLLMLSGEGGIYFPQNAEYVKTTAMVETIADTVSHSIKVVKMLRPLINVISHFPGKIRRLANKAFGNIVYSHELSDYVGIDYQIIDFKQSIIDTEKVSRCNRSYVEHKLINLEGKKVLLIALQGYSAGIIEKMQEMGAEVDYLNDKPNDGFICKVLGRLKVGFYQGILNNYYTNRLETLKHQDYDFILVIRGEYTPEETLKRLRSYYPNSKMILYMWDGLHKLNTKGIEKKWKLYDRIYTFDRIDYEAHKDELSFLPLYYYEEYLPKDLDEINYKRLKYDLSFIGTGHSDRIRVVKDVISQCKEKELRCYAYFFIPHKLVYIYNKLLNRNFKNVHISEVSFTMMPFQDLYQIYGDSKCVMDIEDINQHGLTMRSIELLGLRRKLITTNKDIVHYDFYNPNNILVIERENPKVDMSFFDKPYQILDESIYQKYALQNWILEVLK